MKVAQFAVVLVALAAPAVRADLPPPPPPPPPESVSVQPKDINNAVVLVAVAGTAGAYWLTRRRKAVAV